MTEMLYLNANEIRFILVFWRNFQFVIRNIFNNEYNTRKINHFLKYVTKLSSFDYFRINYTLRKFRNMIYCIFILIMMAINKMKNRKPHHFRSS
jgi:hypothetical protein